MSFNIDSNLRLEFGRQRQAELLQRAQRDRLERGLSDEIANDSRPAATPVAVNPAAAQPPGSSRGGSMTTERAPPGASHQADAGPRRRRGRHAPSAAATCQREPVS